MRPVRDWELLHPYESWVLHAFLGVMLAATRVGITARVLKDAQALRTGFARIILGAAVIEDVLGLITAAPTGAALSAGSHGRGDDDGSSAVAALVRAQGPTSCGRCHRTVGRAAETLLVAMRLALRRRPRAGSPDGDSHH